MKINFDFHRLHRLAKEGTVGAFDYVRKTYPGEEICGYALYSDDDACMICPTANTRSHIDSWQLEAEHCKWSPNEWVYDHEGVHCFDDHIQQMLNADDIYEGNANNDDAARRAFLTFRDGVYDTCVTVLEELAEEGYFGSVRDRDQLVLNFMIPTDYDPERWRTWMRRLNTPRVYGEFCDWLDARIE